METALFTKELDKKAGFNITFNALPEYIGLNELYPDDTREQIDSMNESLERYDTVLFVAEIVSSKCGVELGRSYLGGCHYEQYEDFINEGGYIDCMINDAIIEAKRTIQELTKH